MTFLVANEITFCIHILVTVVLVIIGLRMGKVTLTAIFSLQAILGNLFVTKQMTCFGLNITCSDVYTIGALLSLNLLQEYYGKEAAKKGAWTSAFILLGFILFAMIQVAYEPNDYDSTHGAFQLILSSTPRIMVASLAVMFVAQRMDIALYSFMRKVIPSSSLLLRFGSTALITQCFDTIAFSFLGLYGLVHSLFDIILMSYLIKVIVIVLMAPMTHLVRKVVPA